MTASAPPRLIPLPSTARRARRPRWCAPLFRRAAVWLIALVVAGASWLLPAPATILADGPQPNAPWPQLKRDAPQASAAALSGPAFPVESWRYTTGSGVVSGPVVAADGTIYVGTDNFRVWALRPDGILRWNYELLDSGGRVAPSYLLVDQNGHIVFGTDNGYVVGLKPDGKEGWIFDTRTAPYGNGDPQPIRGAPAAAVNYGRVLFGTEAGLLYELEDGGFAGVRRSEGDGAIRAGAAVTPDGTIIWGTIGRNLHAGWSAGGDKWRIGLDGAVLATPAVANDSTTYAATEAGSVYAIATTGQQRWQVRPGANQPIRGAPALGPDGTIYVGGDEGRLYALDSVTGATKWSFATNGPLTAAPTVGANGLIYVGSNDGRLYVLTPTGQVQAQFQADGPIDFSSPAVGADGTLYVGTRTGTLYALKEGGPASPTAPTTAAPAATPATAATAATAAPPGFGFVRCNSGRVYALTSEGTIGQYVSDPAAIGGAAILQAGAIVSPAMIDAICGTGR